MRPAAPAGGRRRWGWRLVLLAVQVLLTAAPFAARWWLTTPAGQAELRTRALAVVQGAIAGQVEARVVRLDGQAVHLEGLRLLTPEGELVAEVASVDATLRLLDLLRQRVHLEAVRVDGPRLYLVADERGLNLGRAVQLRVPPEAGGEATGWAISVQDLVLERGFTSLEAGSTHAAVEGVRLTGQAEVALDTLGFTGGLEGTGQLTRPTPAPVTLSARADAAGGPTTGTALLTVADCSVRARGDLGRGEVWAEALVLAPGTMRALLPVWPLQVPLTGQGSGSAEHAHLSLQAGPARLEADGTLTLSPLASRLQPLTLAVPGATLSVVGAASAAGLDLAGQLEATGLSTLPAAVLEVTGVVLPTLAGRGLLRVAVHGEPGAPGATLDGELADPAVGGVAARRLVLAAKVPLLTRPLELGARVQVQGLALGSRTLPEALLVVAVRQRELEADLTTVGLGDAALRLEGTLEASGAGGTLRALRLTGPGASWTLEAPARVAWGGGGVEVGLLAVRDGAQRVTVQGRGDAGHLVGELHVQGLDLARLPPALAPPALGLAGLVSLDLAADGAWPWPDASLAFTWTGGALAGATSLEATAGAAWRRQRLVGTLSATSTQGVAEAHFDLPLLARGAEPLSAEVRVSGLDPARLEPVLGRALPVEGVVALEGRASGTAGAPVLAAVLSAPSLVVLAGDARLELLAPRVEVETGDGGALSVKASGQGLGGTAAARLDTPFTLPGLRARVPGLRELEAVPVRLAVDARGLDLARLDRQGLEGLAGLGGQLAVTAALAGPAAAPEGTLTLAVTRARLAPFAPLDAEATATAGPGRTALAVEARLGGRPLLTATASLAAGVRELLHPGVLEGRAAAASVTVLATELAVLLAPRRDGARPSGTLAGTLTLEGTLAAPSLRLAGTLESLRLDEANLGRAALELTGDGQRQRVAVRLGTPAAEDLDLHGTLGLPLGWPRATEAQAWLQAPLAVDLQAQGLDLGFLSGVHPLVRVVEGRLTARGALAGTLAAPTFTGEAHLAQGRVALLGLGDYRQVEGDLEASGSQVALTRLELEAGGGKAALSGRLDRTGPGRWQLRAEGLLDRLPITADDQLLATASTRFEAVGVVSPGLVEVSSLSLDRAEVELPDVKRRDLQDLARPADIVVLPRGGPEARSRLEALRLAARTAAPGLTLRAVVDAPRNLWLRSTDLDVEVGLSPGFRVELSDAVRLVGQVTILGGKASVIGRSFEVRPGSTVRFAGPVALPVIDLAATYLNPREQVLVTVAVAGRGAGFTLHATSEPPMAEADVYTLLATGRRELRRGSGAALTAEDAVSAVGQLAASKLRTVLSGNLPIDVLNFESADNFANLKFDVGKYLSDWLYLGVSAQTGANPLHGENPWAGRLELRLSRRWSLEVYGGTAPAAGADVVWSTDF